MYSLKRAHKPNYDNQVSVDLSILRNHKTEFTYMYNTVMKILSIPLTLLMVLYVHLVIGEVNSEEAKSGKEATVTSGASGAGDGSPCGCDRVEDYVREMKADLLREVWAMIQQRTQVSADGVVRENSSPVVDVEDVDGMMMSRSKLGRRRGHAAESCGEIRNADPLAHSRSYWLKGQDEVNPAKIHCDFDFKPPPVLGTSVFYHIKAKAGWMRLIDLDVSRPHSKCPKGLLPVDNPRRACGSSVGHGCSSLTFSTQGVPYQRVCGMVSGYLHLAPDAFSSHHGCPFCQKDLNVAYLDGVSITYGVPRSHIWSYAAMVSSNDRPPNSVQRCLCISDKDVCSPDFVGQDYHCMIGSDSDELWGGKSYNKVASSCCKRRPGQPWFCKELLEPTTEDIEVRLCVDQATDVENVFLEAMQIYVQ